MLGVLSQKGKGCTGSASGSDVFLTRTPKGVFKKSKSPWACPVCGLGFKSLARLQRHQQRTEKARKYKERKK
jgi:hypothetical protein